MKNLSMKEKIERFIDDFTKITKEECDYIERILRWDDETRAAFFFAKRTFEEDREFCKKCKNELLACVCMLGDEDE